MSISPITSTASASTKIQEEDTPLNKTRQTIRPDTIRMIYERSRDRFYISAFMGLCVAGISYPLSVTISKVVLCGVPLLVACAWRQNKNAHDQPHTDSLSPKKRGEINAISRWELWRLKWLNAIGRPE